MTFGELIKSERKKLKMNELDFAPYIGISEIQLSRYECGQAQPRYSTMQMILDVLGYEIEFKKREQSNDK